jgi:alpha-mannosidase
MFDMTKSEVKEAKAQILTKLKEADKQLKEKFLDKLRDLNKKRHAAIPTLKPLHACNHCLKSNLFKVKYDETGRITSIYDKKRNREWLAGKGNDIQVFEDRPNHWDAWDVNDWFEQKPLDILHLDHAEVVETGALRATVRFHYTTPNGSTIHQDVCIYRSIPRIDFKTNMDWHEQHTLLKVAFPVTVHASHATYEIQYGSIERPTSRNTTWEAAKFEVSGHRWTDLSEGHGGVSLLNDGKYGHDIHHNVMRISLLRTPVHPDPQSPSPPFWFLDDPNVFTDQGKHETNYSFFPHDGDWRNGSVRQGYQFNQPLRVVGGSIGWDDAASVDNEAVYIETLKQAEDGNGFILRCYEAHGSRGDVSLKLPFGIGFAEATDMLEQPTAEEEAPVLEDGKMYFSIKPYEIRTFRILPIS